MEGLVEGRIAIVTGGGRGIGRGICLELARHGTDVAVADLNSETAAAVADEVRACGRRAVSVAADVGTGQGRQAILDAAEDGLGPVDILVNNAGIQQIIDPFKLTEADWDRMMNINAKSVFFLCQLVIPGMVQRSRGAIVNLASAAGKLAITPVTPHYNASKAAVIAITKTWSTIAAPHGVRVNCVCPGGVDTPLLRSVVDDMAQVEEEYRGLNPLGRLATADDVARAVAFLASDDARHITGVALRVDGGDALMGAL